VVGLVDVHLLAHRLGGVPELVTDPRRSTACAQRRQPSLHGVGGGQVNSSLRCGVHEFRAPTGLPLLPHPQRPVDELADLSG